MTDDFFRARRDRMIDLAERLEQTRTLPEDAPGRPKRVVVDLGYRGVDDANPGVEIIHRGKHRSLTRTQRCWLKRRQVIEPALGRLKSGHRPDRCWLRGSLGDALHAVPCAAGCNLRRLMRAMILKTSVDRSLSTVTC